MTQGQRRTPDPRPRPAASRKTMVRASRLVILVALALAQSACYVIAGAAATGALIGGATGAALSADRPAPGSVVGAAVSITLDPSRDLVLASAAGGDTTWVRGARSVVGRVTGTRGDTMWVAVTAVEGARGQASFPAIAGPTAPIVRGPGVAARVVTARANRATAMYVGAAIGAAASVVGLYLWCAQTRCLD